MNDASETGPHDPVLDLALDRALRVRRKWTQEGRPPEPAARAMLVHGAYWMVDIIGVEPMAAVLEMLATELRKTPEGAKPKLIFSKEN